MPSGIPIEQPPLDTEQPMSEYLARQFININNAFGVTGHYNPLYNIPPKPQVGHVEYFATAIPPTIPYEGLYVYTSNGWEALNALPVYGGLAANAIAPVPADGSLIQNWDTVLPLGSGPINTTPDPVAGTVTVGYGGVFEISFSATVSGLANNQEYAFQVNVNGVPQGYGSVISGSNTVTTGTVQFTLQMNLVAGNVVGVSVSNAGSNTYGIASSSLTVTAINVLAPAAATNNPPAFGGLTVTGPKPFPDPTVAWQQINVFDVGQLSQPKYIEQDLVGQQLIPQLHGTYLISVNLSVRHDISPSQNRELWLRLSSGPAIQVAGTTGRQEITRFDVTSFVTLAPGPVILELSSPSLYSNVEFENLSFKITSIG